jgi:transcriptional regulator with XRE-family HTH domain
MRSVSYCSSMNVTKSVRILIRHGIQAKGWQDKEFALAVGKSTSWVSKLLSGQVNNLEDSQVMNIERALGISLARVRSPDGPLSPIAVEISRLLEKQPEKAEILQAIKSAEDARLTRIRKRRPDIGAALVKIAIENPDHPEKVADLAIDLILEP